MKKILKAITFLSLVMCLMLNTNVVYADCNVEKVVEKTLGNGQKIKQVFIPQDKLAQAAKNDKDARDMTKWICSAISLASKAVDKFVPQLKLVSLIAGGVGLLASHPNMKSVYERWLEKSESCGVIVTYLLQKHPGGYYAGGGGITKATESWDYMSVEPQK